MIKISHVIQATSEITGVHPAVIKGTSRKREDAQARHLAMYVAREITGKSLAFIGYYIGDRDHTTCLFGINATKARIEVDAELARDVQDIVSRTREISEAARANNMATKQHCDELRISQFIICE